MSGMWIVASTAGRGLSLPWDRTVYSSREEAEAQLAEAIEFSVAENRPDLRVIELREVSP